MAKAMTDFFVLEDGAVTVDWVVLTAAIVGIGLIVVAPIASTTTSNSANMSTYIQDIDVGYPQD